MDTNLLPAFKGKRWLKVTLRTLHLIGLAGVSVSIATDNFDVVSWTITIMSGLALLILEALSNLIWFVQVRALAIYVKLVLLFALFHYPDYGWHFLLLMIILSGLISHAPSTVRYYSFIHRKEIRSVNDIRG
ncbi:MAG: hypothetical protein GY808_11375 [Gammaproteobacteria bacterium]|nr:hypothetical protein [Gammaproteobacteria bacterium]